MAYTTASLKMTVSGLGTGGVGEWNYRTADARATVEGAAYFSDAVARGMKLGDQVVVVVTPGYLTTIHSVSVLSATAATVNAAVLV